MVNVKAYYRVNVKAYYRQRGTSNKRYDVRLAAKRPGWRKSATGTVYFENRKNRSDARGQRI